MNSVRPDIKSDYSYILINLYDTYIFFVCTDIISYRKRYVDLSLQKKMYKTDFD